MKVRGAHFGNIYSLSLSLSCLASTLTGAFSAHQDGHQQPSGHALRPRGPDAAGGPRHPTAALHRLPAHHRGSVEHSVAQWEERGGVSLFRGERRPSQIGLVLSAAQMFSIVSTLGSLFWTLILLLMLWYCFSAAWSMHRVSAVCWSRGRWAACGSPCFRRCSIFKHLHSNERRTQTAQRDLATLVVTCQLSE